MTPTEEAIEAYFASLPPGLAEATRGAHACVCALLPEAEAAFKRGWKGVGYAVGAGRRKRLCLFLYVMGGKVCLSFAEGRRLADPGGALTRLGKRTAVIERAPGETFETPEAALLLLQAGALAEALGQGSA